MTVQSQAQTACTPATSPWQVDSSAAAKCRVLVVHPRVDDADLHSLAGQFESLTCITYDRAISIQKPHQQGLQGLAPRQQQQAVNPLDLMYTATAAHHQSYMSCRAIPARCSKRQLIKASGAELPSQPLASTRSCQPWGLLRSGFGGPSRVQGLEEHCRLTHLSSATPVSKIRGGPLLQRMEADVRAARPWQGDIVIPVVCTSRCCAAIATLPAAGAMAAAAALALE